MAKKQYDLLFKLLLIGDSGVGKTCILYRFSDDAFNTTFISTIGIEVGRRSRSKTESYIDEYLKEVDLNSDGSTINLEKPRIYKLLVIGDTSVGKTTLMRRFCDGIFISTSLQTLGIDFKIKTIELGGKKIKLQIWDTAGQERFHTITTSYYRGAMGIMLVYDITNPKSFDNIAKWLRNIDEHANEDVEKMILGNKCDMSEKRMISKERGEAIAREHGIRFLETSAKANINVDKAFYTLAEAILEKMPNRNNEGASKSGIVVDKKESTQGRCCGS